MLFNAPSPPYEPPTMTMCGCLLAILATTEELRIVRVLVTEADEKDETAESGLTLRKKVIERSTTVIRSRSDMRLRGSTRCYRFIPTTETFSEFNRTLLLTADGQCFFTGSSILFHERALSFSRCSDTGSAEGWETGRSQCPFSRDDYLI